MIGQGLSMDQAPPISIPFRFFFTGFVLQIFAAFFMALLGPGVFETRWSFYMYALTHFYTLGYLALVMFGALFQMIPVTGGFPVKGVKWLAPIIHLIFTLGSLLMVYGFYTTRGATIGHAGLTVAITGMLFSLYLFYLMARESSEWNPPNLTMGYAMLSFALAAIIGVFTGGAHAGFWQLPDHVRFTGVHITFMLGGWISLLITGVSFRIVPMFFITPEYPDTWRKWFPSIYFFILFLYSGSTLLGEEILSIIFLSAGSLFMIGQAVMTIRLIRQRRRKIFDPTAMLFFVSHTSLILSILVYHLAFLLPNYLEKLHVLTGILFLYGFAGTLVNGMILKIIPFLSWFHLNARGYFQAPSMRDFIPEWITGKLPFFRIGSVGILSLSVFWPPAIYLASLAIILDGGLLLMGAALALRLYIQTGKTGEKIVVEP